MSPTYVIDAARATRQLLETRAPAGLYHCVNSGHCTWLEFAREAGAAARRRAAADAGAAGRRARCGRRVPQYCALSNAKLRAAGIEMPTWQDALATRIVRRPLAIADDVAHQLADRQARRQARRIDAGTPGRRAGSRDRAGSGSRRTTRSAGAASRGCRCRQPQIVEGHARAAAAAPARRTPRAAARSLS